MQIKLGYELIYVCPKPTPMILMLSVHETRAADLLGPDTIRTEPAMEIRHYEDSFGNNCSRVIVPAGESRIYGEVLINDNGLADRVVPDAKQHLVQDLPEKTLVYLMGSRYCETDKLSEAAWRHFESAPTGWARVQAICDFVHKHIKFGYEHARSTKTAFEAYQEGVGVCRDYAHLAITFCRCMNIPARYCTGYLTDIGIPPPHGTMDFAGWFEAYLGDRWYTFDARNNMPRIGRILMARGRDAADVPISNAFGFNTLKRFTVVADEVVPEVKAVEAKVEAVEAVKAAA